MVWSREVSFIVKGYPSRAIEATNTMHVRHLDKMIKNDFFNSEMFYLVMIADGGPDWSVKEVVNFTSMGLFWLKSKMDTPLSTVKPQVIFVSIQSKGVSTSLQGGSLVSPYPPTPILERFQRTMRDGIQFMITPLKFVHQTIN